MTAFYVSPTGSDSNPGSTSAPFLSIGKAMSANLQPGDEVVVRRGTYNEAVNITKDGSAAGYITVRAEVPGEAFIRPPASAWNAISVNADWIKIDGFDIKGARGDGIEGNNVHHTIISRNWISDCGESGIQFNWSEFQIIEGNQTLRNAKSGFFSGISIYQNRNITGDKTTPGFRTIVRDNISYGNVTPASVTDPNQHSDGNGIIIDDFQSTQTGGFPNYIFPTLVENNLVYDNGGKGIQVTWSDSVTVRDNTAFNNNLDGANPGTWRGEIANSASSNNTYERNIAECYGASSGRRSNNRAYDNVSTGGYVNRNIKSSGNIAFDRFGNPPLRTDGGNTGLTATVLDPELDDTYEPTVAGAAGAGWRMTTNTPEEPEEPEEPPVVTPPPPSANKPPVFGATKLSVRDGCAVGTELAEYAVSDPEGKAVALSVAGDPRFAMEGGKLVTTTNLRLPDQQVKLTITATDVDGGKATQDVVVTIRN